MDSNPPTTLEFGSLNHFLFSPPKFSATENCTQIIFSHTFDADAVFKTCLNNTKPHNTAPKTFKIQLFLAQLNINFPRLCAAVMSLHSFTKCIRRSSAIPWPRLPRNGTTQPNGETPSFLNTQHNAASSSSSACQPAQRFLHLITHSHHEQKKGRTRIKFQLESFPVGPRSTDTNLEGRPFQRRETT